MGRDKRQSLAEAWYVTSGTWAQGLDHRFEYTLGERTGVAAGAGRLNPLSIEKESELGTRGRDRVREGSLWASGANE